MRQRQVVFASECFAAERRAEAGTYFALGSSAGGVAGQALAVVAAP